MKPSFCLLVLTRGLPALHAQTLCVKPTAISQQQLQRLTGTWKRTYTHQPTAILIGVKQANDVIGRVSKPPLVGKERSVDSFLCPGGAFLLKKPLGDQAQMFQGVAAKGQLGGSLWLFSSDNKRSASEEFVLYIVE